MASSPIVLSQTTPTLWTYVNQVRISSLNGQTINVAGFDLDSTLIHVKSGEKFSKDSDDWIWFNDRTIQKLRELRQSGFLIVVFTNQKGIRDGKTSPVGLGEKLTKIESSYLGDQNRVKTDSNLFDLILVAGDDDQYRKPHVGMWDYLVQLLSLSKIVVDKANSFYCGDAAGRPKNWRFKAVKDFSVSDRFFANNIGIRFDLPEILFEGVPVKVQEIPYEDPYVDPELKALMDLKSTSGSVLADSSSGSDARIDDYPEVAKLGLDDGQLHLILMVGAPASGKSRLAKAICDRYKFVYINQDLLKTKAKCLKAVRDAVSSKKSIVVDNTNPTTEARAEYLKLVSGYKIHAMVMQTSKLMALHLNQFRSSSSADRRVPMIAYNIFYSKLQQPDKSEGFSDVVPISFGFRLPVPKEFFYKFDL